MPPGPTIRGRQLTDTWRFDEDVREQTNREVILDLVNVGKLFRMHFQTIPTYSFLRWTKERSESRIDSSTQYIERKPGFQSRGLGERRFCS